MPVNGKSNFCRRCGKPVFFAERKTSLGEDWHPSCLSCERCNKVLTPGQHAEGYLTYMMVCQSNVWKKPPLTATAKRGQHKGLPFCNPCYQASYGPQILGYGSNVFTAANFNLRDSQNNNDNNNITNNIRKLTLNDKDKIILPDRIDKKISDLLVKVEEYNNHLTNGRTNCKLNLVQDEAGETIVEGPLRIYWGLESPIRLKQSDEITPVLSPSPTWRHSYFQAVTNGNLTSPKEESIPKESPTKERITRGLDDSALLSPATDTSEVVLRRKRGLRKCNTVAYRGDQGNRWKRASINGHMYNNDTRVFVPVIGSCTSVTITSKMSTQQVIKALLEKFKVENEPWEYSLHIVPDEGAPRFLKDFDLPLFERICIGCDERLAKIFIKEKTVPDVPTEAWMTLRLPEAVKTLPAADVSLTEVIELRPEKQQQLPEGLDQLVHLPEAVLRGLLQKFRNDEEHEVSRIKRKYELARYLVKKRMRESQA